MFIKSCYDVELSPFTHYLLGAIRSQSLCAVSIKIIRPMIIYTINYYPDDINIFYSTKYVLYTKLDN